MRITLPTRVIVNHLAESIPGVRVVSYDGYSNGPSDATTTITIADPAFFGHVLRAPRGLGVARAWVNGDLKIDGDPRLLIEHEEITRSLPFILKFAGAALAEAGNSHGRIIKDARPPAAEYRNRRRVRNGPEDDVNDINFHYGLPPAFYTLVLGESMTYSCAIFPGPVSTLDEAQSTKHELVAKKLQIGPATRLLDIGCGWGGLIRHVESHHGISATGVTAARAQASYLRETCTQSTVHCGDYRAVLADRQDPFDAIASIGMYEHVNIKCARSYFEMIYSVLRPGGRFLNHAIVRTRGDAPLRRNGFMQRYIFPNGHVRSLSHQLEQIEAAGFRIVTIETFGEHYVRTLEHWRNNLEMHWGNCVALVGEETVRAWHMYLIGARHRFSRRIVDLAQVLLERPAR